ncbi:hypothetical protein R1flu_001068 [Riccia fluitans]|uniref:Superoxide dismutase copper/zinc binding domain-containing protein n=1 Tax=Riccia fluitans TaxID=41844 RepID=A0ABD1Y272_9MARC
MNGALSSSSTKFGLPSVDVSIIGTQSSVVPSVGLGGAYGSVPVPMQAVSQKHEERSTEKVTGVTDSQTHIVTGNSVELSGTCSKLGTEGGVAEFRGPTVHGLVRFTQVDECESQIEASFDGLTPGPHSWSVNEYGDVRHGAASTGLPYAPHVLPLHNPVTEDEKKAGVLGTLVADSSGHAEYTSRSFSLRVWDIIGRSVVLYQSCYQDLQNTKDAIACAVIARSSTHGGRQLCSCDGTVIWQSSS